jgi:hypothetical protein
MEYEMFEQMLINASRIPAQEISCESMRELYKRVDGEHMTLKELAVLRDVFVFAGNLGWGLGQKDGFKQGGLEATAQIAIDRLFGSKHSR